MSRTILDPQYANSLNGLFDGTTPIDVSSIVATSVSLTGNGSTVSSSLSTNTGNNMVVSTPSGSGITLSNGAGATTISSTGGGAITVGGSITTSGVYVNGNQSTVSPSLSTNIDNNMVVSTPSGSGITLSTNAGATTISSTGAGELTVGGSVVAENALTVGTVNPAGIVIFQLASSDPTNYVDMNVSSTNPNYVNISSGITTGTIIANSFSGGIAKYLVTGAAPGNIAGYATGSFSPFELTNFVGNGTTTAYTVSSNSGALFLIYTVAFSSQSGTSTDVTVSYYNSSANTITAPSLSFSIIAMN